MLVKEMEGEEEEEEGRRDRYQDFNVSSLRSKSTCILLILAMHIICIHPREALYPPVDHSCSREN